MILLASTLTGCHLIFPFAPVSDDPGAPADASADISDANTFDADANTFDTVEVIDSIDSDSSNQPDLSDNTLASCCCMTSPPTPLGYRSAGLAIHATEPQLQENGRNP